MASIITDLGTYPPPFLLSPTIETEFSINSNTYRISYLWTADRSEQMDGFKYVAGQNAGTVTNGCQVDLYAVDANYVKTGDSLATATFTPSASALNTVAWAVAYTVTAGVTYLIEFKNVLGTPASNRFNLRHYRNWQLHGNNIPCWSFDGTNYFNQTDSQWGSLGLWPNYSSSGTVGVYASGNNALAGAGQQLYNTSGSRVARTGIKFNLQNPMRFRGIRTRLGNKTGTPTFMLQGELCSASAQLSTSATRCIVSTANVYTDFIWETPYDCAADTDYYAVVRPVDAAAGDASNYIFLSTYLALKPSVVQGAIQGSYYSLGSSVSFTEDTSRMPDFNLIFEVPVASGGSVIGVGNMRGGFIN